MNSQNFYRLAIPFIALFTLCPGLLAADQPTSQEVEALLEKVAADWNESGWAKQTRRRGSAYMREQADSGWKSRMLALQKLVRSGESAVPPLLNALKNGNDDQRILAAQALGYLAPHVPIAPLLDAAKNDKNAAVRLYAVDALGMQGRSAAKLDWQSLAKNESNRDVKKHISYAKERNGAAVSASIVETLKLWDAKTMDSARLGKPAPDFELATPDGRTVRLSSFKGKKAVVLVFIYGDT